MGLTPFSGSDRAEFHDRYQNKVKEFFSKKKIFSRNFLFDSMHGLKKIMSMKLVQHIKH